MLCKLQFKIQIVMLQVCMRTWTYVTVWMCQQHFSSVYAMAMQSADSWISDAANTAELTIVGGYSRKGELTLIPDVSGLRQQCLSLHYDTPYAGHLGRESTKRLIVQTHW